MLAGVRATVDLALQINTKLGKRQIVQIDIGGGLPVNFESEQVTPTLGEYANALRGECPGALRSG